jgi:PKD repeat protein
MRGEFNQRLGQNSKDRNNMMTHLFPFASVPQTDLETEETDSLHRRMDERGSQVNLNQPGKLLGGSHSYAENGDYTVTVTVIDDDGGVGSGTFEVSVDNVAPTVQPGPNKTIDEGQSVNIATTGFNDLGTLDTHTALINWGDGTGEVAGVVDQFNKIVIGSHSYAEDRATPYTVTIRVFDDEGGEGFGNISVTVNNVTPVINAGSDKTANENTIVVLNQAFFTDAGVGDVHTAAVNWGDGTVEAASVSESNGSGSITASHVYADNRVTPYTVIVCVDDGNAVNGSACDDFAITINNVAPTVDAGSDQPSTEGQTVTLQGDINDAAADTHTATIDWGDGTEESGSVNQSTDTVSGSHAYADNGIFTVTVTVTVEDNDGASNSDSIKVTVGNVVPTVTASGQQPLNEGDFINLSGTYSDPGFDSATAGTLEDFTATIDWGDGTSEPVSTITLTEISGGSGTLTTGTVQASHAYADDDVYTVTLTVCDDNNGCGSSTLQVTVNNVLPTLEAGPDQDEVTEGLSVSLGSAAFSDPGFDNFPGGTTEDFTATINWGDGSNVDQATVFETSGIEGTLTTGSIIGNHVYSDNGDYTVTLCVSDDDGAPVCDTFEVTVLNTAPTIEAGADQATDEGTEISLDPSTFNDLGTADTHTATIDWGDGTSADTGVVTESPFGPTGSIDGADGTIDGSHIYADNGTYTVTVCVADDEHAETCDTFGVTVDNVEPTVNAAISRGNQITTEGTLILNAPDGTQVHHPRIVSTICPLFVVVNCHQTHQFHLI